MRVPASGFPGIQALRAAAALAVALLHVADEAGALTGTPGRAPYPVLDALPLEAGVDLFFVISGFVMAWTSWDRFGTRRSVPPFVGRRLLRIVPLYWLLSAATLLVAMLAPSALSDGLRDGWGYVVASFLFWPWRRADGFVQPLLRLGWTLEYEMLFYAIVALYLVLPRRVGLLAILACVGGLAVAGHAVPFRSVALAFLTDPIVGEFAFGVLAAIAARRGVRLGWSGALLAGAAVVLAAQWPDGPRVLVRGLPAALVVLWALSWSRVPPAVVLLGDASYALYLVHPFPMRALRPVFARLHAPPSLFVLTALLAGVGFALLLHLWVERPVLRFGRTALSAS